MNRDQFGISNQKFSDLLCMVEKLIKHFGPILYANGARGIKWTGLMLYKQQMPQNRSESKRYVRADILLTTSTGTL